MLEQIVIVGLAGWRLAAMLSYEDGPFDVFWRFRHLFEAKPGRPMGMVEKLLGCVWCTSVYTSSAMAALWAAGLRAPVLLVAAWGAAIVVEGMARRAP